MKTVLVSRDLMFISRVKEVASARGGSVCVAKSDEALRVAFESSQEHQRGLLLVDLERLPCTQEALAEVLGSLNKECWRCIGFYAHVHKETAVSAGALGLAEVMPRSKFVQLLPQLYAP